MLYALITSMRRIPVQAWVGLALLGGLGVLSLLAGWVFPEVIVAHGVKTVPPLSRAYSLWRSSWIVPS